jgi:hypothetical protein
LVQAQVNVIPAGLATTGRVRFAHQTARPYIFIETFFTMPAFINAIKQLINLPTMISKDGVYFSAQSPIQKFLLENVYRIAQMVLMKIMVNVKNALKGA